MLLNTAMMERLHRILIRTSFDWFRTISLACSDIFFGLFGHIYMLYRIESNCAVISSITRHIRPSTDSS